MAWADLLEENGRFWNVNGLVLWHWGHWLVSRDDSLRGSFSDMLRLNQQRI